MPANFTPRLVDIAKALASPGNVNIIGVVVDVMPGVWKSRGTSTCITFTIKDSNLENGHTWDGLKVKYFRDNEDSLPPVKVHDVILLRNLWVRPLQGGTLGVAAQDRDIPWAIFCSDPNSMARSSPICGPRPFEPDAVERRKALSLLDKVASIHDFRKASVEARPPPSYVVQTSAPNSRSYNRKKFSLIKDIEEQTFVDLVGEVIKIYPNDSEKALLYLTDYTSNKDLHDYSPDNGEGSGEGCEGDTFNYQRRFRKKWTGPAGQLSLPVTLWEPHAAYARQHVKEDDIVLLYNVHIKKNRVNGRLEATIHTNRTNPLAANVVVVQPHKDVRAQQLIDRKTAYWESHPRKRKPAEEDNQKAPKKVKSKTRKKEALADGQQPLAPPVTNRGRYEANPNVRAGNPSVPTRSLEAIIASEEHTNRSPDNIEYRFPFQNFCYRTKVRVVDYFPHDLEDFSVPVPRAASSEGSDREDNGFMTWEWRFCLLVESVPPPPAGQAKQQIRLFVSRGEAVYLHGIDAVDLRRNPVDLANLREKLFHVWGNLEELKRAAREKGAEAPHDLGALSQQPFNCCIQEYGVRCRHCIDTVDVDYDGGGDGGGDVAPACTHEDCFGWERRFAMFMTTIEA
ncbi:telomere-binding alpha subunit central domain protein [Aspergillus aculeatinus CBS 121060]|uniref:Telomere-binding alpha subunit central domain protein n=1 Tax=Aspergillus aculeatinus CBS 121060 TaxID=1448322 RepID=A0ACD1H1L0_9EURO|nr:telomere-binding alpha subunit central domain protein [Aspergillus aculeatinus CBS 121060]RAH67637.1 telomere-binding alpha subunit central domain protein [Aspergillus aculeatinus CBS 121060]